MALRTDSEQPSIQDNGNLTYAKAGTKIIKAGTVTGRFGAFRAREAVTISAIEINGEEAVLADYGLDSTTLYQGEDVWFSEAEVVTSITFTGSLTALKR